MCAKKIDPSRTWYENVWLRRPCGGEQTRVLLCKVIEEFLPYLEMSGKASQSSVTHIHVVKIQVSVLHLIFASLSTTLLFFNYWKVSYRVVEINSTATTLYEPHAFEFTPFICKWISPVQVRNRKVASVHGTETSLTQKKMQLSFPTYSINISFDFLFLWSLPI